MKEIDRTENGVALIYWGQRGGGAKFFIDTIIELLEFQKVDRITISARPHVLKALPTGSSKLQIIPFQPILPSWTALLWLPSFIAARWYFLKSRNSKIANHFILMASPWDIVFKSHEKHKIFRVIHDANPHPGDLWPTKRRIIRYCKTSNVIALSRYVQDILPCESTLASLRCLPENTSKSSTDRNDYILIIGRLKEYKNLEETIQSLTSATDRSILIAGLGADKYKSSRVHTIDKWLSDQEFDQLLRSAFVTLCTYSEASQSGIAEHSIRHRTPVIATNVGALSEQIRDGIDGVMLERITEQSLRHAISQIEEGKFRTVGLGRSEPTLAQAILRLSLPET